MDIAQASHHLSQATMMLARGAGKQSALPDRPDLIWETEHAITLLGAACECLGFEMVKRVAPEPMRAADIGEAA